MIVTLLVPLLFALEMRDLQSLCPAHFTDVAAEAGVAGNFIQGRGCAFGDVDGDGFLDLFVASRDADNILYYNNRDGTFSDITEKAGVGTSIGTHGISFGDYDNDGYPDLFVANWAGQSILYRNNGDNTFTNVTVKTGVAGVGNCFSGAFCDVDRDGFIDLFVTRKYGPNALYHNDGNGMFTDITHAAGLAGLTGSFMAIFGDINNDNCPDLYIVNEGNGNTMYLNDGKGHFSDVTSQSATGSHGGGCCGANFGDYNNDGNLDLYVSYSGPNILLENDGHGHFTDVTASAGVGNDGYSRGAQFGDVNNDGYLDLYVGNADGQKCALYINNGDGTFTDMTDNFGVGNYGNVSGCAFGDYNNDGNIDLYVVNIDMANRLYRNDCHSTHYIKVKVVGTISNRNAIGAKVKLYDGGCAGKPCHFCQYREINANSGEYSENAFECHFGVKPCRSYDIEVTFPSGMVEVVRNIRAPRTIKIFEPGKRTQTLSASTGKIPEKFVLASSSPNPFQTFTQTRFALPYRCPVSVRIFDSSGRTIKELCNQELNAGWHEVPWDRKDPLGKTVGVGIYFLSMTTDSFRATNKLIVLK